jgi:hypothetical protein
MPLGEVPTTSERIGSSGGLMSATRNNLGADKIEDARFKPQHVR